MKRKTYDKSKQSTHIHGKSDAKTNKLENKTKHMDSIEKKSNSQRIKRRSSNQPSGKKRNTRQRTSSYNKALL